MTVFHFYFIVISVTQQCNVSSLQVEPASTKENNCLNAAKACNLNDTCKKYRSAYINPCTSRVSASEVCNKRKCHKALRQFFDKVIKHGKVEPTHNEDVGVNAVNTLHKDTFFGGAPGYNIFCVLSKCKVPAKYSYGMLFCACPAGDQTACAERRRQTIVPVCSYEDKDRPNCLSLQNVCKTNYICR